MIKERSPALIALIAVSVLALAVTGCETGGSISAAKQPEDAFTHITRVTYKPGDKGTSVKVYGTGRFEHTSYKLANPLRIAVEIPNVLLDFEPKRVKLNNSSILYLDVVRFKKVNSVRLELELLTDSGYTITQKKNYLELLVANAPASPSGKRAFSPNTSRRSTGGSAATPEKDAAISRLQENIASLERENLTGRQTQLQLEEENRSLKESLEEASIQLEEAGGKANALEARVIFMEGKLSDIQDKMAAESAMPDIAAAPEATLAPQATFAPQATLEPEETLVARTEVEIKEVMAGWLEAWNSKDIDAYSGFYSDDFETDTMDRKTWFLDKGIKFARRGEIEITAKNMEVSLTVEGAAVIFEQRFESHSYRDIGLKIISLTKRSGSWKIVSEVWKPL